jgi:hypothetical protein
MMQYIGCWVKIISSLIKNYGTFYSNNQINYNIRYIIIW